MKLISLCTVLLSAGLILTGCSTPTTSQHDYAQPKPSSPGEAMRSSDKKDPASIVLLNNQDLPAVHYTIIGEATVSRYNVAGIKRQKAIIQDRLRELAAAMGGDAIINLRSEGRYVTGTVISYPLLRI